MWRPRWEWSLGENGYMYMYGWVPLLFTWNYDNTANGLSVQFSSVTHEPMDCSTPGFPVLHQLPELAQTHVHWVSDAIQHLILCHPLLLLPSVFPSIRVFSKESILCIRWPKFWSFSCRISPFNEYSGLISFGMGYTPIQNKKLKKKNKLRSVARGKNNTEQTFTLSVQSIFQSNAWNFLSKLRCP